MEEQEIARVFGFDKLIGSATTVAQFVSDFKASPNWASADANHGFWTLYYAARSGLKIRDAIDTLVVQPKFEGVTEESEVITFELTDYGENGVTPERFALVVAEIGAIYNTVSQAIGDEGTTGPRIIFVDSGSDFAIGLRGAAKVITAIADAFGKVFNAVRYRANERFERNLQSADAGLDFNARIRQRVAAKEIDEETGSRFIRSTTAHIDKLLGNGVTIEVPYPDIPSRDRVLLAIRNQRLLGAGDSPEDSE
ncbi:MAG: hypothetical protein H0W30_04495 [Gemmatimonadaceae bacterium]|nr:hypothetical protein [Gemmatimonadaceae bacterium]